MSHELKNVGVSLPVSRRQLLKAGGLCALGLGLPIQGQSRQMRADYFPPPETQGGWRKAPAGDLGVSAPALAEAFRYHDAADVTTSHGGALLVIHKGYLIGESYTTGVSGGPRMWTADTCNDMKSSTKSVFGTAAGVFLQEFRDAVDLDTPLIGASRETSLVPQIWEQPLTDERKSDIRIKHVLSMTSGLETPEPWLAPAARRHHAGFAGPFQMYEYCFGWWHFTDVPSQHTLKFAPGSAFNYSNYGLEQLALAMRNMSGEMVGPYIYDRVLGPIGMPKTLRDNQYRDMPYADSRELNFADVAGWGVGGGAGCDAYGADKSGSPIGANTIVGSTFRCSARDFARLAYLWLRNGRWEEEQLVPEQWLSQATRRFERDDGSRPDGYGLTFWTGDSIEGVPDDTFMSRGHNMNHSFVVPSLDLIVVRQGNDNRRESEGKPFSDTLIQKIVASIPAGD